MQTKLTLRMDNKVIAKAKRISKQRRQSLSRMVEDIFEKMDSTGGKSIMEQLIPDWIQQLGIHRGKNKKEDSKKSYDDLRYEYLKEKYMKD